MEISPLKEIIITTKKIVLGDTIARQNDSFSRNRTKEVQRMVNSKATMKVGRYTKQLTWKDEGNAWQFGSVL